MMHFVPQPGLTVPAVAGPVERVVRHHLRAAGLFGGDAPLALRRLNTRQIATELKKPSASKLSPDANKVVRAPEMTGEAPSRASTNAATENAAAIPA
jgi:hypothetical protein